MNLCKEPGCLGLASSGKFCAQHKNDNYLKRRNAARPERDAWYSKAAWCGPYGARLYKLRRSPLCEECNVAPATQVHHVDDSWKETGDWRLFLGGVNGSNLVALCHECHSRITMQENHEKGVFHNG
jgi:hypothetical protein